MDDFGRRTEIWGEIESKLETIFRPCSEAIKSRPFGRIVKKRKETPGLSKMGRYLCEVRAEQYW